MKIKESRKGGALYEPREDPCEKEWIDVLPSSWTLSSNSIMDRISESSESSDSLNLEEEKIQNMDADFPIIWPRFPKESLKMRRIMKFRYFFE